VISLLFMQRHNESLEQMRKRFLFGKGQ